MEVPDCRVLDFFSFLIGWILISSFLIGLVARVSQLVFAGVMLDLPQGGVSCSFFFVVACTNFKLNKIFFLVHVLDFNFDTRSVHVCSVWREHRILFKCLLPN